MVLYRRNSFVSFRFTHTITLSRKSNVFHPALMVDEVYLISIHAYMCLYLIYKHTYVNSIPWASFPNTEQASEWLPLCRIMAFCVSFWHSFPSKDTFLVFSHEEELKFIFENGKPDIKSSLLNLCEMLMYNDIIIIVLLGKYLCTHEPTYLHKYINV